MYHNCAFLSSAACSSCFSQYFREQQSGVVARMTRYSYGVQAIATAITTALSPAASYRVLSLLNCSFRSCCMRSTWLGVPGIKLCHQRGRRLVFTLSIMASWRFLFCARAFDSTEIRFMPSQVCLRFQNTTLGVLLRLQGTAFSGTGPFFSPLFFFFDKTSAALFVCVLLSGFRRCPLL